MLEQYRAALLKALGTTASLQDGRALEPRTNMAETSLGIRDSKREQEAEAALAKIGSLHDVTRGEE